MISGKTLRSICKSLAISMVLASLHSLALAASPTNDDEALWHFEGGNEGWLALATTPPFDTPAPDSSGGSLKHIPSNNTNTFGIWESPETYIPGDIFIKGEEKLPLNSQIYRMRTRHESNVESRQVTPQFRLRTFYPNFHKTSVMTVESNANASYCPPVPVLLKSKEEKGIDIIPPFDFTGKVYNHYIYSGNGEYTFKYAFDLLNFGGVDQADGEVLMDYLSVNTVTETPVGEIANWDCTLPGTQSLFSTFGVPGVDEPLLSQNSFGMGLFGLVPEIIKERGADPPWIFGGYTYQLPYNFEEDKIYRLDVTVGTSADFLNRSTLPAFRIRMNDSSFQASWYLNIESTGGVTTLPNDVQDFVYRLYIQPRNELSGNAMIFSFDYLWLNGSGNNPSVIMYLKNVRLIETLLSDGSITL